MITYTLDKPSGVTIDGAEIKKGGTVAGPRSLVARLLSRDGWELATSQPTKTRAPRKARDK